jgi:ParB family transcriptional regulator, chromosome partitioning protein
MVNPKGLGRGLDALLANDIEEARSTDALRMLNVMQLQPGKYQPRSYMDDVALQTLADSIKSQGIMQPILVREIAAEKYEIIAGERRWRASQIAGLAEVPVLVREIADESALAMALIENIQRENLNPLEEAQGIKRLIDEFAMTHENAAEAVGRSRTAVSNLLRLLSLSVPVQDLLMQSKLDMGHARALIGLDAAQQIMLANKIVQQNLSVREVEKLVQQLTQQKQNAKNKTAKTNINQDLQRLQETIAEQLGMRVQIQHQENGKGKLVIQYQNLDELDHVFKRLGVKLDK